MAKAGTQSAQARAKVLAKLKTVAKGAWDKAKKTEPKVKGSRVPGGLVRAIAQLSSWKMDETKDKKVPYVSFTGVIVEPAELAGVKVAKSHFFKPSKDGTGKITKTIDDKFEDLANDIQLLGGDTASTEGIDGMVAELDRICGEGLYYYFNTWTPPGDKTRPNPDAIVMLQGPAANYLPDENAEGVEESEEGEGEAEEEAEEASAATKPKPAKGKPAPIKGKPTKPKAPEPEAEEEVEEEAEEGAEEEQEEGEAEEAAAEPWVPQKGQAYYYKPDAKTKKFEVKIVKVDTKAETVDVQSLKTQRMYTKVPWSEMKGEDE